MKINSLPSAYVKPKKINLASNSLRNVTAILEVNGFIPLLLGNGDKPRVWLYIPATKPNTFLNTANAEDSLYVHLLS